jgi:hypothetical protein
MDLVNITSHRDLKLYLHLIPGFIRCYFTVYKKRRPIPDR